MAKKSAKSKGYRRSSGKKPYLSRKDIVILCVLVAVVAVGAILLFTYDDGALKVRDGKIVEPGERWLIVNGNTRGGRRYFKLGEVGDIDGYTLEPQPFSTDDNLTQFNYSPEAEDSAITGITVSAGAYDPARLAESNARLFAAVQDTEVTDIATAKSGEVEYTYYIYAHSYYESEEADGAEEAAVETEETAESPDVAEEDAESAESEADADEAPNRFDQTLNAYVAAPHNGSVIITVASSADSAEEALTEDQLKAALDQAIAAVTLENGK